MPFLAPSSPSKLPARRPTRLSRITRFAARTTTLLDAALRRIFRIAVRCFFAVVLLSSVMYLVSPHKNNPWEGVGGVRGFVFTTGRLFVVGAKHPHKAVALTLGLNGGDSPFRPPLPLVEAGQWNKTGEPHLCVLVSTYKGHGLALTALLASLFSNGYQNISAVLLDTDTAVDSTSWMHETARVVNSHAVSALGGRQRVYVSDLNQKEVVRRFPNVSNDFGYMLSDLVIEELLQAQPPPSQQQHGLPVDCDYFLVTNGDNVYSSRLVPALLPYMRLGIDMIGFDFTSHYLVRDYRVDHPGYTDQTIHTEFKPAWIDKGACVFRAQAVREYNATFMLAAVRKHGDNTKESLGFSQEFADGEFYKGLAQQKKLTRDIVRRTLLMHL